jgi:monofunctional biosynthetic peptidoglycan transglycosylase
MLLRLVQGHALRQEWVAYERIAPALAEAVIAAEDNRFCAQALGFDFAALRGQVEAWQEGERPRGASTITMQTASLTVSFASVAEGDPAGSTGIAAAFG